MAREVLRAPITGRIVWRANSMIMIKGQDRLFRKGKTLLITGYDQVSVRVGMMMRKGQQVGWGDKRNLLTYRCSREILRG